MNGILNVLKPPGMSSHDVIYFIRRTLGVKKAGHTGTLDPGAAGVLVVCLGIATRLAQFLLNDDKEYRAEITFGTATSSGDSFGEITFKGDASGLSEDDVRAALSIYTGKIHQVPPMTSALKRQGKKLYDLARAGQEVERSSRPVTIHSLTVVWGTGWGSSHPRALLNIVCSKGTYVRTLCDDIGKTLGCGAYMSFLVRTRAGACKIDDAVTLEEIRELSDKNLLKNKITPVDEALPGLPAVHVKEGAAAAVAAGSKLYLPGVARLPGALKEGDRVRLMGPGGLISVAETTLDPDCRDRFIFKPVCVLAR